MADERTDLTDDPACFTCDMGCLEMPMPRDFQCPAYQCYASQAAASLMTLVTAYLVARAALVESRRKGSQSRSTVRHMLYFASIWAVIRIIRQSALLTGRASQVFAPLVMTLFGIGLHSVFGTGIVSNIAWARAVRKSGLAVRYRVLRSSSIVIFIIGLLVICFAYYLADEGIFPNRVTAVYIVLTLVLESVFLMLMQSWYGSAALRLVGRRANLNSEGDDAYRRLVRRRINSSIRGAIMLFLIGSGFLGSYLVFRDDKVVAFIMCQYGATAMAFIESIALISFMGHVLLPNGLFGRKLVDRNAGVASSASVVTVTLAAPLVPAASSTSVTKEADVDPSHQDHNDGEDEKPPILADDHDQPEDAIPPGHVEPDPES